MARFIMKCVCFLLFFFLTRYITLRCIESNRIKSRRMHAQRGFKLREALAHGNIQQPMPESLHLLPSTPQIKGLHTFIRNQETSRDEFIFYSNRLIRLVIEYALGLMPFKEVKVEAPQGHTYEGKRMACEKICGVSILRAGETMEQALCDVCKDIRIGKILIQTNQNTGEPEVGVSSFKARCLAFQFQLMSVLLSVSSFSSII